MIIVEGAQGVGKSYWYDYISKRIGPYTGLKLYGCRETSLEKRKKIMYEYHFKVFNFVRSLQEIDPLMTVLSDRDFTSEVVTPIS